MPTGNSNTKVVALGLDGADLDYIRSRIRWLPVLRSALESGRLFLPRAPEALSGSVWPTFYTGTGPGHHGIYQHLVWDPERMGLRRIGSDWCYRQPFWNDLEQDGARCVVFDVPYSFPVSLTNGVEVTDWATHGQTWPFAANDRDVMRTVRRRGRSPMGRETPVRKTARQLDGIRRRLLNSARLKADALLDLMHGRDWDVFIAVFAELHRGGHVLWSEGDDEEPGLEETALLDVYRAVDSALGRVLDEASASGASILVFSLHGMARDSNQAHLVRPIVWRLNDWFVRNHCGFDSSRQTTGCLVHGLRKKVPARLQHAVGSAVGDGIRQWVVEREIVGNVDWSKTPGVALRTDIRTELRLNLSGRESAGMLAPGSELHDEYVRRVREVFLGLKDRDTGAQLVEDVLYPQALFPGPRAASLPDIVITWRAEPQARRVAAPLVGRLELDPEPVRGGDHTDQGFAILLDPKTSPGALPPLTRTEDFARFFRCLATASEGIPGDS